jgi:hypothetical protein
MSYVKFSLKEEVQKALKGQKTVVPSENLFHLIGPTYLKAVDITGCPYVLHCRYWK